MTTVIDSSEIAKPQAALVDSVRSFSSHAAINPWLMLLIFATAGVMIFYLYRAQQRVGSKRIVQALTTLRLLIVLSLLVLLMQPGYRWKHTRKTAGTLWVMLDSSESMALTDPQSTPIERLRWADALDYFPAELRTLRVGQIAARISCLRDDLARLQSPSGFIVNDESASAAIDRFHDSLKLWQKDLDTAANDLATGTKSKPALGPVVDGLRKVSGLVSGGLEAGGSAVTISDAIKPVVWARLDTELAGVVKSLAPLADEVDREFLAAHGNDQPVREAMAKVAKLSRADLALLDLTLKSNRLPLGLKDLFPRYRVRIATLLR